MVQKNILIFAILILILSCDNRGKISNHKQDNIITIQADLENTTIHEDRSANYIDIVFNELNLNKEDCYNELLIEATLPYDEEKSVFVIPVIESQEGDFMLFRAHIAVFDHITQKITHKYEGKEEWASEGVYYLNYVEIDTTQYKLNSTSTAFGIKTSHRGSSQANPSGSYSISLFIPKGEKLEKVLDNYTIFNFQGETNTICEGLFETEETILSISDEQTEGYNNIVASKTRKKTERVNIEDDCVENILDEKQEEEIIYFENGEYKYRKPRNPMGEDIDS